MQNASERLLDENIIQQVSEVFANLQNPVELLFFEQAEDCTYCPDTHQLLTEVSALSDKLTLTTYDLESETARQWGIDKAPGLALARREGTELRDDGIRLYGIPSGHEFASLIHTLLLVSRGDSGLGQATRQSLAALTEPVHLQVFVTPTCPYCPRAVVLANQMALESPLVQAEMVEATEFPDLADRFNVSGVPQITINQGSGTVVGAVPEDQLFFEIQNALKNPQKAG